MKPHLPLALRSALLAALVVFPFTLSTPVWAEEEGSPTETKVYEHNETWTERIVGSLTLDSYAAINISNMPEVEKGGAVCLRDSSQEVSITNSGDIVFENNSASSFGGGAICNLGTLGFTDNGDITFSGNSASFGGAIVNYGTLGFTGNGNITFSGNSASSFGGGAICNHGTLSFADNGDITFSDNSDSSSFGGAIVNYGTLGFTGNGNITFSGNSASSFGGGAISNSDELGFTDNGDITFSGNSAPSGGAIYNDKKATLNFESNGDITFSGNSASSGGAIYNSGTLGFTGNGDITFQGNLERSNRQLCSLYSNSGTVTLSATTGKSITFYDCIYTSASTTVELNKSYEDAEGNTVSATGSIVFSGATTEADLAAAFERNGITDAPTAKQILASRTSEIGKATTLYAGSLVVRDQAVLNAAGITVLASAETEGGTRIVLDNGTLNSDISLAANTSLRLVNSNSMTGTFTLQDGTALFLDIANSSTADGVFLNHVGTMEQQGTLSLLLDWGGESTSGNIKLISSTGFSTERWTADNVIVSGGDFERLLWLGNDLYYVDRSCTWTMRIAQSLIVDSYQGVNFSGYDNSAINLDSTDQHVAINSCGQIVFSDNTTLGAIYNEGALSFTNNGDISFKTSQAGAISSSGTLDFIGNGNITLSGNGRYYDDTRALYCSGEVSFVHNRNISFENNEGGAIESWPQRSNLIRFEDNGDISISNNGGAIANGGTITFKSNGNITVSGNDPFVDWGYCGGVLFNESGGIVTFEGNGNILFSNNGKQKNREATSTIGNGGIIKFAGNGDIIFSDNKGSTAGAIWQFYSSTISFENNGDVFFHGNTATDTYYTVAGAIYLGEGTLNIAGNGDIAFQGNFAKNDRQLRSLSSVAYYGSRPNSVILSATTGKSITFYDSIYTDSSTKVELNKSYTDAKGNTVAATGAIVFSGATTEEDLAAALELNGITDAPTAEQILASRTSEIGKTTTLYAGSLEVRDNAVLNAAGITVLASAETEGGTRIVLDNAALNSNVNLASGASLHLAGVNTMSGTVTLQDGAVLYLQLGDKDTPVLTHNGSIVQEGGLSLHISGINTLQNKDWHALIAAEDSGIETQWKSVDIAGIQRERVGWKNNVLYCYTGQDKLFWTRIDDSITVDHYDTVDISGYGNRAIYLSSAEQQVDISHCTTVVFTGNNLPADSGEYAHGGAIHNSGTLNLTENGDISFSNNKAFLGVNLIEYGGAVYNGQNATISFSGNQDITFSNNTAPGDGSDGGGAIYNGGTLSFISNWDITFSNNSSKCGGAIDNDCTLDFISNRDITFSGNSASYYDGAIHNTGTLSFVDNGNITFSDNTGFYNSVAIANYSGELNFTGNGDISFKNGAIQNSGTLSFVDNGNITFSGNSASYSGYSYGAIDNTGTLSFVDNGNITFSDNNGFYDSVAIANYSGELNFTGNGDISFKNGAIKNSGTLSFVDNGNITFSGNSASYSGYSDGAIDNGGTLDFISNRDITFSDNTDSYNGGAIYNSSGTLSFAGNGNVTFQGNLEKRTRQLRSLYSDSGTVTLSATTGKSITFYDSIYTSDTTTVELNQAYTDAEGNTVAATGAIVFTGATTEADLAAAFERNGITDAPTAEEILASRTSEFGKATTLYAGSLEVRDNAVLNAAGITVLASAETEGGTRIVLDNGTLNSDVSLAGGTSLQLAGTNRMSGTLTLQAGAEMVMYMGRVSEQPVLTLEGTLVNNGVLTLDVQGALPTGKAVLMSTSGYDDTNWAPEMVSISGVSFEQLRWVDGSLYLNYTDYTPTRVLWRNATGNGVWNTTTANWLYGDKFAKGMDAYFGDIGSGTVSIYRIVQPGKVSVDNSEGHDYTFTGGYIQSNLYKNGTGTLTLANDNLFSDVEVNEGTLRLQRVQSLGKDATVTLHGGTIDLGGVAATNAITADGGTLAGASSYNGVLTILGDMAVDGALQAASISITNGTLTFEESLALTGGSISLLGHAVIHGGVLGGQGVQSVEISGSGNKIENVKAGLSFQDATGTVLNNQGNLQVLDNGGVSFDNNSSSSNGGAICNSSSLSLIGNEDISLLGNTASSSGGAIYNAGTLGFTDNGDISFSGNTTSSSGGAIYNAGTLGFTDNGDISFSGNTAYSSRGGAICNAGTLDFTSNGEISFSGNNASTSGGAITNDSGARLTMSHNGNISFTDNAVSRTGAAICSSGTLIFNDNGDISFSGNNASDEVGAICNWGTLRFERNGDISIENNTASRNSAAIYNSVTLVFAGNGDVTFQGNLEKRNRQLRSLYSNSGTVTLSATTGKSITFYDSIYTTSSTTVELNKSYTDAEGNTVAATGAIVFSGATAEVDLAAAFKRYNINGTPKEAQILASRTSEIGKVATLYAGSLEVRDNAVLNAAGITVLASAETAGGTRIVLDNGTLNSDVDFASATSLSLAGCNSISGNVTLQDDSWLRFTLSNDNLENALLTLNGGMEQIGFLNLGIELAEGQRMKSGYKLITLTERSSFDDIYWNDILVEVTGLGGTADFSKLRWEGNTLYYGNQYANEVIWNGGTVTGSGSAVWDKDLSGWLGGDWNMAITVKFTDAGSGTVTLVGNLSPEGVLVEASADNFYVFSGEGSLTGEMSLSKKGKNVLTINTSNSYTGGTVIHDGTVVVGNAQALGLGTVLIKNGALDLMGQAIQNAIFAEGGLLANAGNYNGDLTVGGEVQIGGAVRANNMTIAENLGKLLFGTSFIEGADGKEGHLIGATIEHITGKAKAADATDTVTIRGAKDALALLDDVHIDIAEGSVLELEDVALGSGVRITDDPATVLFKNAHLDIVNGENATATVGTVEGANLLSSQSSMMLELTGWLNQLSVQSDIISSVTMDGTSLTIYFSGFELTDVDLVKLTFGEDGFAATFAENTGLSITGVLDGRHYIGFFDGATGTTGGSSVYFTLSDKRGMIPEPGTTTLSLLALAALAYRRRRKAA